MKCLALLLITFALAESFPLKSGKDTELETEVNVLHSYLKFYLLLFNITLLSGKDSYMIVISIDLSSYFEFT